MKSDSKHHYEEKTNKGWLIHDRLIYVAILTPGHDQSDQNNEISDASVIRTFHQRVSGISLWNRMRSSITPEGLGAEPLLLHNESRQLRWSGDLTRILPGWGVSGMPSPEADPRHSGKIPSFGYFKNILVSPWRSGQIGQDKGGLGVCLHCRLRLDGWMKTSLYR